MQVHGLNMFHVQKSEYEPITTYTITRGDFTTQIWVEWEESGIYNEYNGMKSTLLIFSKQWEILEERLEIYLGQPNDYTKNEIEYILIQHKHIA